MTTPPRLHRSEVTAALARIARRRRQIEDERFALVDADEPVQVIDYLRKSVRRLPPDQLWVARADVGDGLVLHVWQWWEDRRREYELLTAGVWAGVPLSQLGAPLGLGSGIRSPAGNRKRGVQDRIDRLEALLKYDRPDAAIVRAARQAELERANRHEPQTTWLQDHRGWVASTAARLLAYEQLGDAEVADCLEEVRADWMKDAWTPGSLVWMGLAAAALRASPQVLALGKRHAVHRAVKHVEDLRTAFAGVG